MLEYYSQGEGGGLERLRETSLGVGRIFLNLEKGERSLAMMVMLVVIQKY